MTSVWGIDLGTTNSCISRIEDGVPKPVAVGASEIVPSIVLFDGDRVLVGREAQNLELTQPERCIRSVKRRMGRGPDYTIGDRTFSPEAVSAEILKALVAGAQQATGATARDVVITVPAYFDDAQRRATLKAGELAGLHVLRLLNEPTSASLVYDHAAGDEAHEAEIVLVYDLGGGTFDVSVLEVFDDVREVRATAGNTQLGGDDFDELLYRRFVDELKHERGVDVQSDARARTKLRRAAERTKIALSSRAEVRVSEEFIAVDATGAAVHLDLTITRRELEELMRPLLDSTIALSLRAIDDAKLGEQRLTKICLVGGSTRIPLVRDLLAEAFPGVDVHEEINPDLAVALGAAVQGALLQGESVSRILVDVAAHSLGILVIGEEDSPFEKPDTFAPVLRRNTVLPGEKQEDFYTAVDAQKRLVVDVYQGEARRASLNRKVGSFDFELEPMPERSPIRVTFSYDLDGVVRVTVEQPGTARQKTVTLRLSDAAEGNSSVDTPLLRKAKGLLSDLDAEERTELLELIEGYERADDATREAAEEALLDFLVDLDDSEEG
jgi:molecular chaperone DnaK